jgi:DNA polymerase-3 subunit delta
LASSFQTILRDLHQGKFAPVYLFDGEEPFFIDQLTDYIEEHALEEAGKAFDQIILYGRDVDGMTVVDEIKRYPMMGQRRVVIVKEAQQLRRIEALEEYIKKPLESNILVLAFKYKKMDGKKAVTKYIRKNHVYMESKRMYENQMPGWIDDHMRTLGYHIDLKAAALLTEFVGNDLSRLNNELQKLMLVIPPSRNITPDDIERNIGVSKDYNNFELLNALAHKDVLKANRIIKYFGDSPKDHPPMVMTSVLFGYFSKLMLVHTLPDKSARSIATALRINPFFARDYLTGMSNYGMNKLVRIIGYLREFDLRTKGVDNVNTSNYDLMRELIFKILH